MYPSQSNSQKDNDSRIHRIINDAKFEVEEIQRRHRQNETDAENLDKELAKMLVEGEAIEREERQLREQAASYRWLVWEFLTIIFENLVIFTLLHWSRILL